MIDLSSFLNELYSYSILIPSIVLCYLPMKNQLKLSPLQLGLLSTGVLCLFSTLGSYFTVYFDLNGNMLFCALLIPLFLFYYLTVRADFSRCLCVFISTCSLMGFLCDTSALLECVLCPQENLSLATPLSSTLYLGLGVLLILCLGWVLLRYGAKLVNEFTVRWIWYVMTWLMSGFLLLYIALAPSYYSYLRIGTVFVTYCAILLLLFGLQIAVYFFFYQTVMTLMALETERRRVRLLTIQEKQFQDQQSYLAQTSRLRHDFRHTILALKGMADAGDTLGLAAALNDYADRMPVSELTNYCENAAVNTTLNFYAHSAREAHIRLLWKIDLPADSAVADMDLCGILGNTLENAVRACENVPENDRFIRLTITTMGEPNLYIVASNSFDGQVKLRGGKYQTTRPRAHGSGLGLESIVTTAEKYRGSARFHHEGHIFCTDIRIPLE